MQRVVFLDRDGVLNHTKVKGGRPYAPTTFKNFKIIPGTLEALNALKKIGFALVVVTNQPDVGNGNVAKEVVQKMNSQLLSKLPIDAVEVCYHAQTTGCNCRKPKPGMILTAATTLQADLPNSYMIGDRWSDISAGKAAGCTTIFIDNLYTEKLIDQPDIIVTSLIAAADTIISQNMDK
jgi:D-glycero-D-manno-heptose 1,7-bisphosphate phosphatase